MAFGNATFSDIGTAVSDIFAAQGDVLKAKGAEFEQKSYLEAADLAKQNEQFTEMSTAIKQSQADRNLYQALGRPRRTWPARALRRAAVRSTFCAKARARGQ